MLNIFLLLQVTNNSPKKSVQFMQESSVGVFAKCLCWGPTNSSGKEQMQKRDFFVALIIHE